MADVPGARALYAAGRWSPALDVIEGADDLGADDLEFRATLRYLVGDVTGYFADANDAYRQRVPTDPERAARTAAWLGIMHHLRGETGHRTAWFTRAAELVAAIGECAASAYLQMAPIINDRTPDRALAIATAQEVLAIAVRTGDVDAAALIRQTLGHLLIRVGRVDEGVAMLDDAMLAASSGRLTSPLVELLVASSAMAGYRETQDLERLREWHNTVAQRDERRGAPASADDVRRLYRAELLEAAGDWDAAVREAEKIEDPLVLGDAWYLRGEIARRRGQLGEAEEAYANAEQAGRDPLPGRASARAAAGRSDAVAQLRVALTHVTEPGARARLLPAAVELVCRDGVAVTETDLADASAWTEEFEAYADRIGTRLLRARADQCRARLLLATGDPAGALGRTARAGRTLGVLRMPYERARTHLLAAAAQQALGVPEAAAEETDLAARLLDDLGVGSSPTASSPLSPRESEVLALVAEGATNREIAGRLFLSHRTVDRHVSNILTKLALPSRAAAAAWASQASAGRRASP
ncbi:hypothetical protein GCM10022215_32940 [Nocardioides fonticola]|uniref:HTH luxR-type domain-containing protein n=1 Tax=Nocardioides fonticola TaxID=450363 RepID=A0ABP7XSA9_9ACTN